MSRLERNYHEGFVARLAAREKQIQQHYRPVISVHKWFARRPGSLFRALTLAEFVDAPISATYSLGYDISGVCLDPFMGGGTPLLEASRVGLSVVGYDTNPMARWIVERELEDVDPDELASVGEAVARDVDEAVGRLYVTDCPKCGGEAPVRYFIWIRHHLCSDCGRQHALLAESQIVSPAMGRHPREVHVCPHCLAVQECRAGRRGCRCCSCGARFDDGFVPGGVPRHCECGTPFKIPPHDTVEEPRQKLVVVEYDCAKCATDRRATRHSYKQADERDHQRLAEAETLAAAKPSEFWPTELIPRGHETARLLRWGYLRWVDLFTPRQLHGFGVLEARISSEPEGSVKRALQTIFSDLLRYQNVLCRYDRQALKPTDIFAMHGFPVPRVSCEVALMGRRGVGSGGFRHCLAKYVRAKRWCRSPYETSSVGRVETAPERIDAKLVRSSKAIAGGRMAYLKRGSLKGGELAPESVDIVLTDPPYFANVQYAELMDFCYAWLRHLASARYLRLPSAKTREDAVGSTQQQRVDLGEFAARLSGVFVAAADALKAGGPFCFTYHHNELRAYAPVVMACLDAGLVPTAVYACPSEMRASTHIHQRKASTVDTLFVLRKPPLRRGERLRLRDLNVEVEAHAEALVDAGLSPTDADLDCLRSGQLAARCMLKLAPRWVSVDDTDERFTLALETLLMLAEPMRAKPLAAARF